MLLLAVLVLMALNVLLQRHLAKRDRIATGGGLTPDEEEAGFELAEATARG
jgi:hypothetical protein